MNAHTYSTFISILKDLICNLDINEVITAGYLLCPEYKYEVIIPYY